MNSFLHEEKARSIRKRAYGVAKKFGGGHMGGSMSVVEILIALFLYTKDETIIYSKDHCSEAYYAALEEFGIIDLSNYDIKTHCEKDVPHRIYYSAGSLGQGLGYACGIAYAQKLNGDERKVYCVIGDAECDEGQVYESFRLARSLDLDNLVIIVDANGYGVSPDRFINPNRLATTIASLGMRCHTVDGHDVGSMLELLRQPNEQNKEIRCIIAKTVKGKGSLIWENNHVHMATGDMFKIGGKPFAV